MRFTCEKSMLVQGLNIAGRTVAQKSSLSVIEGILCTRADLWHTQFNKCNVESLVEAWVAISLPIVPLPARMKKLAIGQ